MPTDERDNIMNKPSKLRIQQQTTRRVYKMSHIGNTYIGIQLSDKAGEVVVLKVSWEQSHRECVRVPDHKAVVPRAP